MVRKTRRNTRGRNTRRRNTRRRNTRRRNTRRRSTRRRSTRRRNYRGGSHEHELEMCKKQVEELKNRLMMCREGYRGPDSSDERYFNRLQDIGNLFPEKEEDLYDDGYKGPDSSDKRFFSNFNKRMMGGPNSSDERYFNGLQDIGNLFHEKEDDIYDESISTENKKRMNEKKLGMATPINIQEPNEPSVLQQPVQQPVDQSPFVQQQQPVIQRSRYTPSKRVVPKLALERAQYWKDRYNSLPQSMKNKLRRDTIKAKRRASSKRISGRNVTGNIPL